MNDDGNENLKGRAVSTNEKTRVIGPSYWLFIIEDIKSISRGYIVYVCERRRPGKSRLNENQCLDSRH